MHQRSFQQSPCSTSLSKGGRGSSRKMFFVAGAKNTVLGVGNERRSIYQKFREVDLLDKKKTVTALKPGEDRAILLGLGMIVSSVMMYFVLGITILRSYAERTTHYCVLLKSFDQLRMYPYDCSKFAKECPLELNAWTEEGVCVVLNSTVTADMNCSYNCGSDCWRVSKYPCLQVYVSVNNTGRISRLSHNEETQDASSECFYVPRCQKDRAQMHTIIMNISERLKANQQVPCYFDPSEQQETVLLTRLYDHRVVFHSLMWPSCMFVGGALIIVMVKLTQYLSRLCEEIRKIKM